MKQEESELQTIYINIDDSGKISRKEDIAVYGGIVFLSKREKDKFITQYRSIINDIKCRYCRVSKDHCHGDGCPELKHNNLKNKDIRRIVNYIKKYFVVACVIKNADLYDYVVDSASSKGRYNDYALRRTIKGVIFVLVHSNKINPHKPIKLIINIDEQSTRSNGYYNLKDGLFEELKYGIVNFNYGKRHTPIVYGDLNIVLTYQKSDKSFVVQAADLIAGTVRKSVLFGMRNPKYLQKTMDFIDYKLFLP